MPSYFYFLFIYISDYFTKVLELLADKIIVTCNGVGETMSKEIKKPENSQVQPVAPKGNVGSKVGCTAVGCKLDPIRFEFCKDHFDQFKFGLINKKGEPVLDYEKKFEHYQKWLKARKVA